MKYSNGGVLITKLEELPDLRNLDVLFLDVETTSGNKDLKSTNPWHNSYLLGICIGDMENSYYIPVGHNRGGNLPWEEVYKWLEEVITTAKLWVNHNIKYDMHAISINLGIEINIPVFCTMTQAKIIDSDRLRGYGLDDLARDWLGYDISHHEKALAPYLKYNKDYGWIPADVLGYYGTDDVIATRMLYLHIMRNMPDECVSLSSQENDVTHALYLIERNGMNIDVQDTQLMQLQTIKSMLEISEQIRQLLGYDINPTSDKDCFDLLINIHGLPVIAWTEKEEPSFDKHALLAYQSYPNAPVEVLKLMLEYRRLSTFNGTFLTKYLETNVDGVLHPSYNQTVRTGRMSCKDPNMQQLMKEAKALIIPPPGHVIVSADYSQIEYRLIVHYIQDPEAIAAYHANPDQDYHSWVAAMCGTKRRAAKTINFLMGFGGGKARLIEALSSDPDIIATIKAETPQEFKRLAAARAMEVYNEYHNKLPGLRLTSRHAETLCRQRGYIRNLYGRRRHLPSQVARKAFNTVNQSSAADLMKEAMVKVIKAGYRVIGLVHDEIVMTMPKEQYNEEERVKLAQILEHPSVSIRVPIRCSIGVSENNWLEASESSTAVMYAT